MKEQLNISRLAAIMVAVALAGAVFAAYPSAVANAEGPVATEHGAQPRASDLLDPPLERLPQGTPAEVVGPPDPTIRGTHPVCCTEVVATPAQPEEHPAGTAGHGDGSALTEGIVTTPAPPTGEAVPAHPADAPVELPPVQQPPTELLPPVELPSVEPPSDPLPVEPPSTAPAIDPLPVNPADGIDSPTLPTDLPLDPSQNPNPAGKLPTVEPSLGDAPVEVDTPPLKSDVPEDPNFGDEPKPVEPPANGEVPPLLPEVPDVPDGSQGPLPEQPLAPIDVAPGVAPSIGSPEVIETPETSPSRPDEASESPVQGTADGTPAPVDLPAAPRQAQIAAESLSSFATEPKNSSAPSALDPNAGIFVGVCPQRGSSSIPAPIALSDAAAPHGDEPFQTDSTSPSVANNVGDFKPSSMRDSLLAISAGIVAVLGIAVWLRRQQRGDEGMAAVLGGPNGDGPWGRPGRGPIVPSGSPSPFEASHLVGRRGAFDYTWDWEQTTESDGDVEPVSSAPEIEDRNAIAAIPSGAVPDGAPPAPAPTEDAPAPGAAVTIAVREPPEIAAATNGHAPVAFLDLPILAAPNMLATNGHGTESLEQAPPTLARVSVVIPAKNEERSLPDVLDRLPPWLHEVILVDGLSDDATSEVARRHIPNIRVVSQSGRGKGNALREGFKACTGDLVVALDADGSMDPEEITTFVACLESGFDYVKGSRMVAGGSSTDLTAFRRFGNWLFRSLTNILYGSQYTDLCYGYFAFRRGTVDAIDLRSSGFEIETEISIKAHLAGLRTAEVPSRELPRHDGRSNLSPIRDGWRILTTILRTTTEAVSPAAKLGAVAVLGLWLTGAAACGYQGSPIPGDASSALTAISTESRMPQSMPTPGASQGCSGYILLDSAVARLTGLPPLFVGEKPGACAEVATTPTDSVPEMVTRGALAPAQASMDSTGQLAVEVPPLNPRPTPSEEPVPAPEPTISHSEPPPAGTTEQTTFPAAGPPPLPPIPPVFTPSPTPPPTPAPTPLTPSQTPTPAAPVIALPSLTPTLAPLLTPALTPESTLSPTSSPMQTPTPVLSPVPTPMPSWTPTATPAAPTTPAAASFSFGASGDLGATDNTSAVLNAVNASGVNFFVALGDLSYSDVTPESAWCDFVKARVGGTFPFELLTGNHEDDGPDGLITNFDDCLPHRLENITGTYGKEFYFDYPTNNPLARFINISPNLTFPGEGTWNYNAGTARYNWTASAIDEARAAGIKWVIVSIHKYCIAMASESCQIGPDVMNLLIEKKVDLYLQGHDHAFYRSKQLAHSSGCSGVSPGSFDGNCVVDNGSDGTYGKGAGTVIVTTGAGGKSINSVDANDPEAGYFASWMGSNTNPTYGFLKVTVSETELNAQFVRGAGGTYSDTFTIQ